MNKIPPFYKQEHKYSCSLAVLRMVLASRNIQISEQELINEISVDYRNDFKNIWNPTIAKLGQRHGLATSMYALWPLFKSELLQQALQEYEMNPKIFNVNKYENPDDKDESTEPLPLAYKEMFEAVKLGCKVEYKKFSEELIKQTLNKKNLLQTSIKLHLLYPGKKHVFHSILIYKYKNGLVFYHDPTFGEQLSCTFKHLMKASSDVGACIVFSN